MRKFFSVFLIFSILAAALSACSGDSGGAGAAPESAAPSAAADSAAEASPGPGVAALSDWGAYDELINRIRTTTDFEERVLLMHEAEDIVMDTGGVVPIYYNNDVFMQKPHLSGIYSNLFGTKFFMYAEGAEKLRLCIGSEPGYLDPALSSTVDGAALAVSAFTGLYSYDEGGQPVPALAESCTVSEDGCTYVFTLRDGLKWSDGSELSAHDFVYSWKRAADPLTAADYGYMFEIIEGYDTGELAVTASEDGKELTVRLNAPCAYMLDLCAFPAFLPVKQSEVEKYEDYETNPGHWAQEAGFVCNGPFVPAAWTHNESMVYVKNENYWDAENVKVESLEFMLSDDDTAVYAAYNAGDLDFIDMVPTDELSGLIGSDEFHITDILGTYYICFNTKSDIFNGMSPQQAAGVRRAVSLLIDREYICENIAQTGQLPANTFIPPGMADGNGGEFRSNSASYSYPDAENTGYFSPYYSGENVEEARALMEEAGFVFDADGTLSAGTPFSFEYLINNSSAHSAVAEAIQQDLGLIGINVSIRSAEWAVFLNERKAGNCDAARGGWTADFNDPINMLEMWTTNSGNNDCQFGK